MSDLNNLMLYDQACDPDVIVGHAVYFDTSTGRFARARASGQIAYGQSIPDNCAYALGIVVRKLSDTACHICMSGVVEIDFTEGGNQNAIGDFGTTGIKYLSSSQPGVVAGQYQPFSIPMAFVIAADVQNGKSTVAVSIPFEHVLSSHKHYRFELENNLWEPAASFASTLTIPTGAVFGYKVSDSSFADWFPPPVMNSMRMYCQESGSNGIIGELPDSLYEINQDGIWWKDSSFKPWEEDRSLILYYTSVHFNTNEQVVESLKAAPHSGITISNARTGQPDSRGHLVMDIDLQSNEVSTTEMRGVSLKRIGQGIDASNGWLYGPVVESVRVNSASLSVSGSQVTDGMPHGVITLTASDSWDKFPLPVQNVHLDQMRDGFIGDLTGLSFPGSQRSGFSGHILIPKAHVSGTLSARFKLTLATGAPSIQGELSSANFTGRFMRIPAIADSTVVMPMPLVQNAAVNDNSQPLIFNFDITVPSAYSYFTVISEPIEVSPDDMVWFSFYKESGGYASQLLLLRQEAFLEVI